MAEQGHVTIVLVGSVPDVGPDVVSFAPPPFDVVSDPGMIPVQAFTDYPLT